MFETELEQGRLGEFGGRPESSPGGVEPLGQLGRGRRQQRREPGAGTRTVVVVQEVDGHGHAAGHRRQQRISLRLDLLAAIAPSLTDRFEDPSETRGAMGIARRKVGTGEEGPAVGGEKNGHGPTAPTGHGLDGLHVDGVDVGTFFAIHLHGHEAGVHHGGGLIVLE